MITLNLHRGPNSKAGYLTDRATMVHVLDLVMQIPF